MRRPTPEARTELRSGDETVKHLYCSVGSIGDSTGRPGHRREGLNGTRSAGILSGENETGRKGDGSPAKAQLSAL